jgi:hypothetical protein
MIKRFVIKRYLLNAYKVGEMESYAYIGEPIGYDIARNSLAFWTKKLHKHFKSIKPLSSTERFEFGGYNHAPERIHKYICLLK